MRMGGAPPCLRSCGALLLFPVLRALRPCARPPLLWPSLRLCPPVFPQLEAAARDDGAGDDGDPSPSATAAGGGGGGTKGFAEQVLALVPPGALGAVSLAYRLLYLEDAIAGCRGELGALLQRGAVEAAGEGGGRSSWGGGGATVGAAARR